LRSWRFLGELCGQKLLAVKKPLTAKNARVRKEHEEKQSPSRKQSRQQKLTAES
jgi:hypothetical protein